MSALVRRPESTSSIEFIVENSVEQSDDESKSEQSGSWHSAAGRSSSCVDETKHAATSHDVRRSCSFSYGAIPRRRGTSEVYGSGRRRTLSTTSAFESVFTALTSNGVHAALLDCVGWSYFFE